MHVPIFLTAFDISLPLSPASETIPDGFYGLKDGFYGRMKIAALGIFNPRCFVFGCVALMSRSRALGVKCCTITTDPFPAADKLSLNLIQLL